MKTTTKATSGSSNKKLFLVDLPVAKVSFFQVIPGVKVPVREEREYGGCIRWHAEAFNCLFRQICVNPLYSHWSMPLQFIPKGSASEWSSMDDYAPRQLELRLTGVDDDIR